MRCIYIANLVTVGQCADNADVNIFYDDLKRSKGGQGDLVFGVPSGFISGSVRAALQVSECSGYNLCYPG